MQLFEDLIECKNCAWNVDNKCTLYPGKNVGEEGAGCYVGLDKYKKQKLIGGILSERK